MDKNTPLYNSRIFKTYLEYLTRVYPDLDQEQMLVFALMKKSDVEDPTHWFSQEHSDRFQEYVTRETGNPTIAREAGRFAVHAQGLSLAKKYTLGLLTPHGVFSLIGPISQVMSKGSVLSSKRISTNKVEIIAGIVAGVEEKPYQCLNRRGSIEAIPYLFMGTDGLSEEVECRHKGGTCCRYNVSWPSSPFLFYTQARNILLLIGAPVLAVLWFMLPAMVWLLGAIGLAVGLLLLTIVSGRLELKSLTQILTHQGDVAKELMEEMSIRKNYAALAQDIGTAASALVKADELILSIVGAIAVRLEMERVRILLLPEGMEPHLRYAGFGYTPEGPTDKRELLDVPFYQDRDRQVLMDHEPQYIDLSDDMGRLSDADINFLKEYKINSLVMIPIIYENTALGTLGVERQGYTKKIELHDINTLLGVAAQIAVSVVNNSSIQRLQQSEKKYRELVENANSIIVRFDIQGHIIFFNEFAQQLFGYQEHEILGKNIRDTLFGGADTFNQHLTDFTVNSDHASQHHVVSENEHVLRDGQRIWIAWTYRPIFDHAKKLIETLCIGNDITKLKIAQEEKAHTEAQLFQAQKMEAIGTLAGGVAHDFNNLLMGILGSVSLILEDLEPHHPHFELVSEIQTYSHRAANLTRQLLGYARGGKYEIKPVDINLIIQRSAEMFSRTKKEIDLMLDLDPQPWIVEADSGQIEQVLLNHYVNAWQAMPGGGRLVLRTKNVQLAQHEAAAVSLEPGRYIKISVEDNGEGMSDETQKRVFDPFFTTKGVGQGTGLGLASAFGIIKNHGGNIKIQSAIGQGAIFEIYLPASEKKKILEREDKVPIAMGKGSILLVDDENLILNVGQKLLSRLGYSVTAFSSGESALDHFKAHQGEIDLVILDMIMPGMNGGQVYDRLQEIDPEVKVILCSGYSLDRDAQVILDRGCNGFLQKPFSLEQLAEKLQALIKG